MSLNTVSKPNAIDFFRPYEGMQPYLFISYAHKNTALVLPVIRTLYEGNYRLWYDEGIPAGSDWPRNIDYHMRFCNRVIFFCSMDALASDNCFNEITNAIALGKQVLCICMDEFPLPQRWRDVLLGVQQLSLETTPEATAHSILQSGFICENILGDGVSDGERNQGKHRFNGWIAAIVLGALLLLAAGFGMLGLQRGWFASYLPDTTPVRIPQPTVTPVPTPAPTVDAGAWASVIGGTVSFDDAATERAVRNALNQPDGEISSQSLLDIAALHLVGGSTLKNDGGIAYDQEGNCFVNGAKVARGTIEKLEVYGQMPRLTELTLAYQSLSDISDLKTLMLLSKLNLSGNDQLTAIPENMDCPSLKTLDLSHTKVKDLTPLNVLPSLKTVFVSPDMFPLVTGEATQRYDVVLVS